MNSAHRVLKTIMITGLSIIIAAVMIMHAGLNRGGTGIAGASYRSNYRDEAEYNAWGGGDLDTEVHLPFVNSDPDWNWRTTVTVQNTNADTTTLTLRYRYTNGVEANIITDTLPPMGSHAYPTTGIFTGSLIITATHPVAAIANESPLDAGWTGDGLMSYRGIGSSAGDTDITMLPIYRAHDGWNSVFAVQNMGTTAASVTLDFYDLDGNIVHSQSDNLPSRSAHWYDVAQIAALGSDFSGRVRVQSTGGAPIAGFVHAVNAQTGEAVAHNNCCLEQAAYRLYLPHLNNNNTSEIVLYNLSTTKRAYVVIDLYSENGAHSASCNTSLASGATRAVSLGEAGCFSPVPAGFRGSAIISSDQPIGALVNTDWPSSPATFTGYSGVGGTASVDTAAYAPFVRKTTETVTQIGVQNAGSGSANVYVTYYDENGNPVGNENATVPSYAAHYFQGSSSLPTPFRGSAVVTSTESVAVVSFISHKRELTPNLSQSYKSVNLANVEGGDILTYTIVLRNTSSVTTTATFTDSIPAYTTYVSGSAQASDDHPVTLTGGVLHWSGSVISGTPVIIQFSAQVTTIGLTPGDIVTNAVQLANGVGNAITRVATFTYNPGYRLSINDGMSYTNTPTVTLRLSWGTESPVITLMQISNDGGFGAGSSSWISVSDTYNGWQLDTAYCNLAMPRTVYVRFRDSVGTVYGPVQDDIIYDPDPPQVTDVKIITKTMQMCSAVGRQSITVRITASDDNSGVGQVQISHDMNFEQFSEFAVTGNTTDIAWPLQPSGIVYVRARDRAGNWSPVSSKQGTPYFGIYLPIVLRNCGW